MKCFALFALASVALARPADDAAAVAPLVYGLPYGALAAPGYALPYAAPHVAYAHAPVVYNALDSGLVYPVAEPSSMMPQVMLLMMLLLPLRPMCMTPPAMSRTTLPLKPRLTSTTPLAMLKK